ncbi:hypothetical protein PR003_g21152 [Phytophthora rubi]|uniref:Secreted protein n=1 Tax=Phytophthora rubi TaxID=129364 RepID=A0A6A3JVN9_9STRA|nr:hypothetical protein PR002_g20505 [Phytophthora rubi]KAE8996284.1 hypothetical protein PR001_g19907 [Phytophthora rubi]KAE9306835.1 hypothetical protein PR003_g21152 [Phytophthora rubi]
MGRTRCLGTWCVLVLFMRLMASVICEAKFFCCTCIDCIHCLRVTVFDDMALVLDGLGMHDGGIVRDGLDDAQWRGGCSTAWATLG